MDDTTRRTWSGFARAFVLAGPLFGLALISQAAQAQNATTTANANAAESTLAAGHTYSIPAGDLAHAIDQLADQSGLQIIYESNLVEGKQAPALSGTHSVRDALTQLLAGTNLDWQFVNGNTFVLSAKNGAAADSGAAVAAASDLAANPDTDPGAATLGEQTTASVETARRGGIEEIIVTAQKKAERIQDIPIAISAFSAEDLSAQKIEGGFDLLKAIPNVTFSKTNFSSYNFSIRGIGTQAISATTDPGVAVSFNNTTLIHNRLFEQEYLDVERVEVLRGPQGTLYGRNATAGVINVISAKPDFDKVEGSLRLEGGNYDAKRVTAMGNLPLIGDMLAVRIAGAMTERTGYDFNTTTGNAVNGRDLWSGRLTIGFHPTDRVRSYLLWEHFEEDDNRSRTGKQLCHRDQGPTEIGGLPVGNAGHPKGAEIGLGQALFSQGCKPGSLYAEEAFGTPNGLALPFVFAPLWLNQSAFFPLGYGPAGQFAGDLITLIQPKDPYGGRTQSRDLRKIESILDPKYRAEADVVEFSVDVDVTDDMTLSWQTVYNEDQVYSFQDFNRFTTDPLFTDTATAIVTPATFGDFRQLAPGGVFCDPQVGCTDTLAGFDISQASSRQFSQELRLVTSFDGPVNFSFGANYTDFETLIDYYVFYNLITAYALTPPFNRAIDGNIDVARCGFRGVTTATADLPAGHPDAACPYIDPNPIERIDGEGHNYFRSKNPYSLKSRGLFGELYWNLTPALKMTAGLRYTDDTKTFTPVPSQVLTAPTLYFGGTVNKGYPEKAPIVQQWGEWTGRLGFDWQVETFFTDQTMVYVFYSRGYKGGGANPPQPGFATEEEAYAFLLERGGQALADLYLDVGALPILELTGVEYGRTFEPEFVNAFEFGSKNTLLNGAVTLNFTGFYYDYTDYQVSQIRDRSAVNENFDAKIWGLELETVFAPTPDFLINANVGYLRTRIGSGEESIDIMNRTQGNPDYVVTKGWAQLPSNCVIPTELAQAWLIQGNAGYYHMCGGLGGILGLGTPFIDPATGERYSPLATDVNGNLLYPEINGGAGLKADLGGNELPNAPRWTANLGMQYSLDIGSAWRATVRGDGYWQDDSWARVYNADPYDRLQSWYNVNLSTWVEQIDWGLKVEVYVKNLLNDTPITGAFLNSDDTALTTNVFTLDPRLIGISIRKDF